METGLTKIGYLDQSFKENNRILKNIGATMNASDKHQLGTVILVFIVGTVVVAALLNSLSYPLAIILSTLTWTEPGLNPKKWTGS